MSALKSLRVGPLLMVAAGLAFTIMIVLVQILRQEMEALDVVFWRALVSVPLAFALAAHLGLALTKRRIFAIRIALGFSAMVCFYTAAKELPITDLSLISKLQPILVAVFAPLFLGKGERSGFKIAIVLVAGLAGCVLIIAPDRTVSSIYGLWALAAAIFSAGAHVAVRALGETERPRVVVFWTQVVIAAMAFCAISLVSHRPPLIPPMHLLPHMIGAAVAATAGQVLMTTAYQKDRAAPVAAASYTSPIWGIAADLFVFSRTITTNAIIGGVLILGAGATLLKRDSIVRPDPV